ncbi:uncharacterized protein LOC132601445 [Lycium barbarum]|uniref:uncharacterized protein LOC132601445 n=1 Tax=Lycium barbarum TaxID=112863 RepID=UPI00293E0879|nr:uncharacterized protein LOC132601445 [Lycium barbarum]
MVLDIRVAIRRFVLGLKFDLHGDANMASQNNNMTITKTVDFVQSNDDRMKEEKAFQKEKEREIRKRASATVPKFSNDQNRQNSRPTYSYSQTSVAQKTYDIPICSKCSKRHPGVCRMGMVVWYGSRQQGHFQRDYPSTRQGTGGNVAQSTNSKAPRNSQSQQGHAAAKSGNTGGGQNRLYALAGH